MYTVYHTAHVLMMHDICEQEKLRSHVCPLVHTCPRNIMCLSALPSIGAAKASNHDNNETMIIALNIAIFISIISVIGQHDNLWLAALGIDLSTSYGGTTGASQDAVVADNGGQGRVGRY